MKRVMWIFLMLLVGIPTALAQDQQTHIVQRGENLFRIALRYGVDLDELAQANNITDRTRVLAGQELMIPGLDAPDASDEVVNPLVSAAPVIHTVQRGEYLTQIAREYDITVEQLLRANNLTLTSTVYPGQELQIWTNDIGANTTTDAPDETAAPTAAPTDEPESESPLAPTPEPDNENETEETITHTVQRGEHLSRIASAYGVNWTVIAEANGITNPNSIYAGQTLSIPGGNSQQAAAASTQPRLYSNEGAPGAHLGTGRELVVDLSSQMAYAYEDGTLVKSSLVSTGLPATPTVQGDFKIWHKTRSQTMSGPGYWLPNVEWVMYFYQGYGFHGTYWHNNFGNPMSHGCVNMTNDDARFFYEFASIGTPVHVQW